jgi:fructose-bisphosphate aldolase class II
MPMVHLPDLLRHAWHDGYAIGAYDLLDTAFLEGILAGAEACRAPVILSLAESHFSHYDLETLMPAVVSAARRSSVPVAVHLDHGRSPSSVERAIRLGCNSVMVDASDKSLEDNTAATRAVVRIARGCGVAVEAELGYVPGVEGEDAQQHPGALRMTGVEEAQSFVEATGVDCLAVSIGTVHGRMRGTPRLDFERLAAINRALQMPLVIHGGTGLSEEQYRVLVANGVTKINYYTALADAAGGSILEQAAGGLQVSYTRLAAGVRAAVRAEVERTCRIWGAAGRAEAAAAACRPWREVEHVILYNVTEQLDEAQWADRVARGMEVLGAIPGVRRIAAGKATRTGTRYAYCWLMRFAAPEVIASFREHPDHVRYADAIFRPAAPDRLSIDFELD